MADDLSSAEGERGGERGRLLQACCRRVVPGPFGKGGRRAKWTDELLPKPYLRFLIAPNLHHVRLAWPGSWIHGVAVEAATEVWD